MIRQLVVVCLAACGGTATAPPPAKLVAVPTTPATAIATSPPAARRDIAPPWTLTASDGSGLVLARVDAKAVFEGPLAFTELHLYFRNPEDRVREGTFQITLPVHAAVSRFAMENAGQWLEAEVVPKLVARRAYDDFLHRAQDPALLERAAGNQFTAKVFPIPAKSDKHLVISYSQELPGSRYVLPLRGLPKTERFEIELASTGPDGARAWQRLAERDWQPDRDFVSESPTSVAAVSAGSLIAAQVEVAGGGARDVPAGITLLVDTSASRGLGFAGYVAAIRTLVGDLRASYGDALPLAVVAFDQDTELVFAGRAADYADKKLLDRGAAGASDLGQALAWIGSHAPKPRVVIASDGVITAGVEGKELQARVAALAGVERLDFVLAGGLRDDRVAAQLVRAGLPRAGAVLDLDVDPVAVALGESVAVDVPITVTGATWVYPTRLASARAGAKVMVFARMPAATVAVEVAAGGKRTTLHALAGTAPLVERAVAGAELADLEASLATVKPEAARAVRAAITQKSVAMRVLSSETSMLVLESDADYARYGIERKALADVLVVGPRGVERRQRATTAPIPARIAVQKPPRAQPAKPSIRSEPVRDPEPHEPEQPDAKPKPVASGPDGDRDGIADTADRCPSEPESYNGIDDDDGCPDRGRVIVTDTSIEILDNIYFEVSRATIKTQSFPILDAVAATMQGNVDIHLIEVQGHTDERGDDAANLQLSDRRAAAVKDYLVAKGVAASRLSAQGYGESQPLDRRHTEAAWAKNRRVAFLILRRGDGPAPSPAPAPPSPSPVSGRPAPPPKPPEPPAPVIGELAVIQKAIAARDLEGAFAKAREWHAREPGNVLALIGLGEVLEARKAPVAAARAYGSIIDLFPGRADMRRFAGERLARIAPAAPLMIDTFRRAVADRPDHMTGHRLLAYAYLRANLPADAFAAIVGGLEQKYRAGSYEGGLRVLGDDAAMIGAVYAIAEPAKRAEITSVLAKHKLEPATRPSTRFILYWETDANDVDFHIRDARGGHAYYEQKKLPSGGELYADVTTGYGPECFAIQGAPQAAPYKLSLEYYRQGPMGYGMGLLEVQTFDPKRGIKLEVRPFVIMNDHAKVDLGSYR